MLFNMLFYPPLLIRIWLLSRLRILRIDFKTLGISSKLWLIINDKETQGCLLLLEIIRLMEIWTLFKIHLILKEIFNLSNLCQILKNRKKPLWLKENRF